MEKKLARLLLKLWRPTAKPDTRCVGVLTFGGLLKALANRKPEEVGGAEVREFRASATVLEATLAGLAEAGTEAQAGAEAQARSA